MSTAVGYPAITAAVPAQKGVAAAPVIDVPAGPPAYTQQQPQQPQRRPPKNVGASRVLLAAFCCCMPSERIDIVEWLDNSRDTVVARYKSRFNADNELKYGSRLIVREGQAALFVNGGRLADVFGPGTYTLETDALPILSTLQGWAHGFDSPFKAEVYFVSTRVLTGMKWGTPNPVIIRDAEFGTIRVRAFGQLSWKVSDPATFLREMVGTDACFRTEDALEYLRGLITTKVARALGSSGVPVADIAGRQDLLETVIANAIAPDLAAMGIAITRLIVENVSLPPEVERALDTRTRIAAIGNLDDYAKLQSADAMELAAANPGGMAGAAMGMQMGWALSQQAGARIRDGWAAPAGGGGGGGGGATGGR